MVLLRCNVVLYHIERDQITLIANVGISTQNPVILTFLSRTVKGLGFYSTCTLMS